MEGTVGVLYDDAAEFFLSVFQRYYKHYYTTINYVFYARSSRLYEKKLKNFPSHIYSEESKKICRISILRKIYILKLVQLCVMCYYFYQAIRYKHQFHVYK